jgi:hypothetical protein
MSWGMGVKSDTATKCEFYEVEIINSGHGALSPSRIGLPISIPSLQMDGPCW